MTDTPTPQGARVTDLVLDVFRLNGLLLAEGDRLGADIGLTSARWQILGALDDGPRTVPQIARAMGLTRQGAQRTVNVLAAEGLVDQRDNPDHKRAKLVALTAEGRRRLDAITARQVHWARDLAAGLDPADLNAALGVVRALRAQLERTAP